MRAAHHRRPQASEASTGSPTYPLPARQSALASRCALPALCISCRTSLSIQAGHSAAVMLEATGVQRLHEFDLMAQPYSNASRDHALRRYPGRFELHEGNSRHTVKSFGAEVRAGRAAACNLWFLDGAHSRLFARDLPNALAAAAPGALFMVDDVSSRFPKVQKVWQDYVAKGKLTQRRCSSLSLPPPAGLKGWCIGVKPLVASKAGGAPWPLYGILS